MSVTTDHVYVSVYTVKEWCVLLLKDKSKVGVIFDMISVKAH